MRIRELLTEAPRGAARLTKADCKLIFSEIETGHGGIAALVEKKPFIAGQSQEALAHRGTHLRVYRAVAVFDTLKPESVVSASLDWRVAHEIGGGFPLLMGDSGFHDPKTALLRYDVPLERVLAYVPLLVTMALDTLGPDIAAKRIQSTRGYGKIAIEHIIETARKEQEVVCDVSGLTPEVLHFEKSARGNGFYHAMGDIANGTFQSGQQYLQSQKAKGFQFVYGEPQEWDDHASAVRRFLDGNTRPEK